MTTELPDILNSIRKDLHSEIDRVFTNGSQSIYVYLTKKLEETHAQQLKEIYDRLDKLSAPAPVASAAPATVSATPVVDTRIPEVYFTDVNISEAVQNIEMDAEDGTVHEEDDVLTVHDDVSHSEVIEQEEDIDMVVGEVVEELDQVVEEQIEVVEEDQDQEVEDNSESLNEIEVDGVSYYYDSNGDVWGLNEESEPVAIIGKYNETDGEFELFSQDGDVESDADEAEPEGLQCEEFTYKGHTYLKDDDNNVYTTEGEETGYKFVNNKLVKSV